MTARSTLNGRDIYFDETHLNEDGTLGAWRYTDTDELIPTSGKNMSSIVGGFDDLCVQVHTWAKSKGWWTGKYAANTFPDCALELPILGPNGGKLTVQDVLDKLNERNKAELLMLKVTEIAEACEGLRHGDPPSEHIPDFSAVEEELADTVIRIADMCGGFGYRLGEAIEAKMAFNEGRPYRHGKEF